MVVYADRISINVLIKTNTFLKSNHWGS